MSRIYYIDMDGNESYYGYEDDYDASQQTKEEPDGVGYTTVRRIRYDTDGNKWYEDYNIKTGEWEFQYYLDSDIKNHNDIKPEECQRGIWCEKCEHYMLNEDLEFCELMITCKSFKLKGDEY